MKKSIGIALFVVGVVVLAQLGQSDFEFPLDADFRSYGMMEWRRFFTSLAPLSRPYAYAYFDGQLIVNGFVGAILQGLLWVFPAKEASFPNYDAYSVAAALIVSIGSYAGACVLFYAALLRAGANVLIAAVAAIALLLSPQVLDMPLLRQDFLITLPMMVVFYCSVVIAREEQRLRHAILLGLALGFLATIKLTGPMFVGLPVFALVARWRSALTGWRQIMWFTVIALAVFAAIYVVLMARFVYYFTLAEWLALYPTGVGVLRSWKEIIPWEFSLYYNDDLVRGHGPEFIALYAVCTVACVFIALRDRDSVAAFLVLALLAYSLYSAGTMKYNRGGYHLVPLFIAVVAYTAMWLWHARRVRVLRYAALAAVALVMMSSLSKSVAHYGHRVETIREMSASLGDLWRPAQQWLKANVKTNDRICIETHSEWTLPLTAFLPVVYGPFDYPYPDGEKLSKQEPPDDATLRQACDFLVIESYHQSGFALRRRMVDPANAERWAAYFRELPKRVQPVRFETSRKAWLIKWIEIYRVKSER